MATATREAFGKALARVGEDPRIVVLDGDLMKSNYTYLFRERFPERFVECGIAEANMIGIAVGLALSGKIPFASSFSCFLTGRFETVRVSVAYNEANVRLCGTHSGIGIGEDGYSQMALEDVAAVRTLPNFSVVQPCDAVETERAVEYLVEHRGPVFLRLTRQKLDDVNPAGYRFEFGRAVLLRDGTDVTLIGTGATVQEAVRAADALGEEGISARVLNVHTIRPIDAEAIRAAAAECGAIVTVEDHHERGGLGSAVAEVLATGDGGPPARLRILGVREFGESGKPEELYEKHGISARHVAEEARRLIGAT